MLVTTKSGSIISSLAHVLRSNALEEDQKHGDYKTLKLPEKFDWGQKNN